MHPARKRSPSQVLKKGYSDEEVEHIYELGRFSLENGDLRRSEVVLYGLTQVAPDFAPAWLAMSVLQAQNGKLDDAAASARRALGVNPEFPEAMLVLAAILLTLGDYNAAGTYLGEVGDRIDSGVVSSPHMIRLYRAQLLRYDSR